MKQKNKENFEKINYSLFIFVLYIVEFSYIYTGIFMSLN